MDTVSKRSQMSNCDYHKCERVKSPVINSAFPNGLNQDTPPSSDASLPTVHEKTHNSDFPIYYGVPSSSDSNFQ